MPQEAQGCGAKSLKDKARRCEYDGYAKCSNLLDPARPTARRKREEGMRKAFVVPVLRAELSIEQLTLGTPGPGGTPCLISQPCP